MDVNCDPSYLESIVQNLLTNSIKYRHLNRGLLITLTAHKEDNKVKLVITDNGLGIDLRAHGNKVFGMYNTFHGNKDARGLDCF